MVELEIVQLLAREPDQAEPGEVVEVAVDPVVMTDAGLGADHRQPRCDQVGLDAADGAPRAHVDGGAGALEGQEPQDPGLVGCDLRDDARVGGVGVDVVLHVGRAAEQLGPALAELALGERVAVERDCLALDVGLGLLLRRRRR